MQMKNISELNSAIAGFTQPDAVVALTSAIGASNAILANAKSLSAAYSERYALLQSLSVDENAHSVDDTPSDRLSNIEATIASVKQSVKQQQLRYTRAVADSGEAIAVPVTYQRVTTRFSTTPSTMSFSISKDSASVSGSEWMALTDYNKSVRFNTADDYNFVFYYSCNTLLDGTKELHFICFDTENDAYIWASGIVNSYEKAVWFKRSSGNITVSNQDIVLDHFYELFNLLNNLQDPSAYMSDLQDLLTAMGVPVRLTEFISYDNYILLPGIMRSEDNDQIINKIKSGSLSYDVEASADVQGPAAIFVSDPSPLIDAINAL